MPPAGIASRPRVAHAIANFFTGGSSRLVVDLTEHLGHDYEHAVLTSAVPSPPAYVGLPVSQIHGPHAAAGVAAWLDGFRPDLVHVHYWGAVDDPWYTAVFRAALDGGYRVVENVNTPVAPHFDARIARYVYVSEHVLERFGRRDGTGEVIHPGSDFELFSADRAQVPESDCVGMVYRLEPDKLDAAAIEPFIRIVQRRPGTRALIVGGGTYLAPYRAAVAAAGMAEAFTFTGYVPYAELPAFYARMSVFLAPVWQESFGQVSPFAMSMGIPVVGYDVGALEEIIGTDRLLAPAGDADGLAQLAIDLLDDPARSLAIGRDNQARARALFSVQSMVERYAALYRRVLA